MERFSRRQSVIIGIAFLVSTLGFAAGYFAARDPGHAPIIIEACSDAASSSIAAVPAGASP